MAPSIGAVRMIEFVDDSESGFRRIGPCFEKLLLHKGCDIVRLRIGSSGSELLTFVQAGNEELKELKGILNCGKREGGGGSGMAANCEIVSGSLSSSLNQCWPAWGSALLTLVLYGPLMTIGICFMQQQQRRRRR